VALHSAQRDRVVAGPRDDAASAAAGLAVQPLLPFGSDISSDRLLTVGIERSRGSVPGKRFHDPLKRVVDRVLAAAHHHAIAGLGHKEGWSACRLFGIVVQSPGGYRAACCGLEKYGWAVTGSNGRHLSRRHCQAVVADRVGVVVAHVCGHAGG
jgi:hypothetical protein